MNKIKRTEQLLKASSAVLFREKRLLLFPFIATALVLVVALFYIAPIALYPTGHSYFTAAHWSALAGKLTQGLNLANHSAGQHLSAGKAGAMTPFSGFRGVAPFFALIYFTSMFVATFCNVAFYHEIMEALNGNTVSIRRGFRFAATRWRAVLVWSLFAGAVGYIISAIEKRVGFAGTIIANFVGFAWGIASIFIIPTLIREEETESPLKLLRASAGTLKRTWGEFVIGVAGMELAFGFAAMLLVIVSMLTGGAATFFICWYFHWTYSLILPVVIGEWFLLVVPLGLIGSAVSPVYRCALFVYATEGVVPDSFDKELLDSAWKVK
jgi:hypothetical protein